MKTKSVFTAIGVTSMLAFGPTSSVFGITWDGGSNGTNDWIGGPGGNSGERNWDTNNAPAAGDPLVFAGTSRLTSNNNTTAGTSYNSITFASSAGAFTLTGNSITLAGSITNSSANLQTISLNLILSGNRTIDTASGNITIGGVISGSGFGIIKQGNSTLTLSGPNTYTGLTDIQAGTLTLGASSVFADASTLKISGGILSLLAFSDTVAGVQLTAGSITSSTGVLTSTTAFDLQSGSVSAKLGGSVGLNKTTGGTVTLSGANTYTGNTTISAGTLALSGSGSIAAAASTISVASGATLDVSAVTGGSWTVQGINSTTRQILTGAGGVTGATVIGSFGTHNAGSGGVGTQAFSSSLTYSSGSIFEWDLDVNVGTETHDKITAGSLAGSGAQFKILLGSGDSFSDTFWNSTRNWTAADIFGASNAAVNLANIFSSFSAIGATSEGSFSFTNVSGGTGNQLTWTAVPESTSALAGILLGAGLLRRKRSA